MREGECKEVQEVKDVTSKRFGLHCEKTLSIFHSSHHPMLHLSRGMKWGSPVDPSTCSQLSWYAAINLIYNGDQNGWDSFVL